jgi:hypothetical protein
MRRAAFDLLFGLVVFATGAAATPASASSEWREWRTVAGKLPSKNEFAAVLAACEERVRSANQSGALEGCLADYGLRRVQ